MKIAILTSGVAPVPPTKGGAVECLVEHILNENEINKEIDIDLYSIYEKEAEFISHKYKKTSFKYIKSSRIASFIDNSVYFIINNVLGKKDNMKFRNIFKRFEYIHKLKKCIYSNNYDKVILQNHPTLFLSLKGKNKDKYKNKYYIHLHNEVKSLYGCDEVALNCKKIIGISDFICKSTSEFMKDYPKDKFSILYNCIDTDRFNKDLWLNDKANIRKKYEIKENEIVMIFSGRLTAEKGIKELIKAFKLIKSKNIKLLVVGSYFYNSDMSSSQSDEIDNLVKDIKDKIIFTGYIQYDEIPKVYAIADFAVLPSMWEEPAGLTIIESMSTGLPIITTESGGIPEYVTNECAFIIKRGKDIIKNLAEKIEILSSDKELREAMGKASRERALKFNIKDYYKNFINIIKD
ncbi:glycosyl transferases group 1 family protein [Clostridium baratii str. Sullivan]|uniref:Glycosyl transferases group 1 family protein n=1 Tax=Clostridium baratii str. Sullivan TaxID=1415775 RepID=A0A0A7G261_9CLOT|nr:glycosyltransferase family 4 protein [Clostridium baratii]AIY85135.1 glycosyl transferases group 1 family protein [Clostridium baratii str. Sullivan]